MKSFWLIPGGSITCRWLAFTHSDAQQLRKRSGMSKYFDFWRNRPLERFFPFSNFQAKMPMRLEFCKENVFKTFWDCIHIIFQSNLENENRVLILSPRTVKMVNPSLEPLKWKKVKCMVFGKTTEKVEPGEIPEILVLKKRLSGFVHAWIKYGLP